MTQCRYKLTNETMLKEGKMVTQIAATRDFVNIASGKTIKKGQLGGWVGVGVRLTEHGTAWIDEKSFILWRGTVSGHAYVTNSTISDYGCVDGKAIIRHSRVCGSAVVQGNAKVINSSVISTNAFVGENATIDGSKIKGGAGVSGMSHVIHSVIKGNAELSDSCSVFESVIKGDAELSGDVYVGGGSKIGKNVSLNYGDFTGVQFKKTPITIFGFPFPVQVYDGLVEIGCKTIPLSELKSASTLAMLDYEVSDISHITSEMRETFVLRMIAAIEETISIYDVLHNHRK